MTPPGYRARCCSRKRLVSSFSSFEVKGGIGDVNRKKNIKRLERRGRKKLNYSMLSVFALSTLVEPLSKFPSHSHSALFQHVLKRIYLCHYYKDPYYKYISR